MTYLIVFLAGGLGAAARHAINLLAARLVGPEFPYGTLFINVSGSFAIGLAAGYFALKAGVPQYWRLALTTGLLGGYTTFSAFSLETALLYERGHIALASLYVVASVALAIGALFVGLAMVRALA